MIFKFIRDDGETLVMEPPAWGIYDLDGLAYPDVSFGTESYAFADGSYWTKAQAEKRVISFKARHRRRDQNYFVRDKIGGFFNHLAEYRLYIVDTDAKDGYFEGKITDFEMPVKKANSIVSFELEFTSVNPFIQSVDDFGKNLNEVTSLIHYPRHYLVNQKLPYSVRKYAQDVRITNEGGISTGFVASVVFAEATSTFKLQNHKGQKIDITKAFAAGDILQIDTKNGVCRLNGTKFYKGISNDSEFFVLYPGDNYLTYNAAIGESTLDLNIYYRSQRMVF